MSAQDAYVAGLHRRRDAAQRLPALDQSCRSDPWHYDPPEIGDYEAAAAHLLELGLTPAPNPEGLRVMRKRGGRHFRAAKLIAERWDRAK